MGTDHYHHLAESHGANAKEAAVVTMVTKFCRGLLVDTGPNPTDDPSITVPGAEATRVKANAFVERTERKNTNEDCILARMLAMF